MIRNLTDDAWTLPFVRRVESITHYQRVVSHGDEIGSQDLIGEDFDFSPASLAELKRYIQSDVLAANLVSDDFTVTAISAALNLPENDPKATQHLVNATRSLLKERYSPSPEVTIHTIGSAFVNVATEEAIEQDAQLLLPSSYLFIFILMFLLLRNIAGVALTIAVITLSIVSVLGGFIWFGGIVTPVIGVVPNIILIIAIADCMHLLVSYYYYLQTQDKHTALRSALQVNFSPMLLTSLTTAIGFLCLNFSKSPPYRDVGNLGASAALIAFVITVSFVPACLSLLPAPRHQRNPRAHKLGAAMDRLGSWVTSNPLKLMLITAALAILTSTQASRNHLSENWVTHYDESFAIRQALDLQQEKLGGARFLYYKADTNDGDTIFNPAYMHQLNRLTEWLRQQPQVGSVSSFSDQVKNIQRALGQGHTIPEDRELLAQSILIYEMSLPFGMGTEEFVNIDKTATRLSLQLENLESTEFIAFDERVRRWAQENTPAIKLNEGTGLDLVFAHLTQRNLESLIYGTGLALVLISLLMIFALRSIKLGLISLIPNLVPAAMAYGVWGMLVGRVDISASAVATISLGLIVDDTIHFLSKYQHARQSLHKGVYQAIQYAFHTVGVAMLITSVALAVGFALLIASHYSPTWVLGAMLSITIVLALIVDFLLLPGLLVLFDQKPPRTSE